MKTFTPATQADGERPAVERTRAVRLDQCRRAPRIDVIKMDIEGAEAEVDSAISAFLEAIARRRSRFHAGGGVADDPALLASGYELEALDGAKPRPRGRRRSVSDSSPRGRAP